MPERAYCFNKLLSKTIIYLFSRVRASVELVYVLHSALLHLAARVAPFQGRSSPNFFQGIFLYCYQVILVVLYKGV